MDWDKLKIFHAVAEAGSFTSATVILNLSQSAISRQIQSLEEDLKVKLFERHARGLTGMPKSINDLNKHKFISFGRGAPSPVYNPDWALKLGMPDGKKRKPIMKVNSVSGLLLAVESGVGLAALPEYLVNNSNNVIKVLPKSEGPITEAHFVYPQSLKNTARVQAFRNFLFSKIGDWKS